MKRVTLIGVTVAMVVGLSLTALAHNFEGYGDCDGWTLQLNGDFGATEIFVDEVSVGLAQTIPVPDDSDDTERTFVVRWDKAQDVIVTHELERDLSQCTTSPEQTTTTSTAPTTTTSEATTTTVGATTTEPTTTTTVVVEETSTTLDPTTTVPVSTVPTDTPTSSTPETVETLPFTGPAEDAVALGMVAFGLFGLGWMLVRGFRAEGD